MQPFTNPNYFQQTVPVSFNAGGYNPYMRNQMMTTQQDLVRSSVVQPTVGMHHLLDSINQEYCFDDARKICERCQPSNGE